MNNTIDMTSGKLSSKIIRFTIPIMITNLLQVMYNAADILVVGRFTGEYAVAAIGATSPIYNIIINFLSGISIGANICCASHIGAKDEKNVSKIVHSTICLSLLLGLLFSFIGISFSKPLLGLVNTPKEIISLIGSCGLRCLWIFWVFKMYPTPDTLFLSFPTTWLITFIASFVAYIIYMKKKIALAHNNVN